MENEKKEQGLRYNEGKLRYDLLHPVAQQGIVKVLTKGSIKYAPRNWEKGMPWSTVVASLKRHLASFESGEDFDPETGELHMDHIQCNAHFISAYYKIAPGFDDRAHITTPTRRIGLDIDDVICNWVRSWCKKFNLTVPSSWQFQWNLQEEFKRLKKTGELDDFYLSLPINEKPENIPFVPTCYITHRPVSSQITEKWLSDNGFALSPVFSVTKREEKLEVAKHMKLDIFVDDNYDTFKYFNENGICCYLYDANHNKRHDVGYRRIKSLKELKW